MNKEIHSGMVLTLLLIGMLTMAFNIQQVEALGTIYIRPDGSIDPPTAPILRDGDLYTLTGNITSDADGIVIERNNMTLDGADYTVQGTVSGDGIDLSDRSNVTIKNMRIKAFQTGIYLKCSSNNIVSRNNITADNWGIRLWRCSSNTISENNITNNTFGIDLTYSSSTNIVRNEITNNDWGIFLAYSSNNTISGSNITANNYYGIDLREPSNNNTISENNITANKRYGICLQSSSNNTISGNNITNNNWDGICLTSSSTNTFYHNHFFNNTQQVYISGSGYPNYWDDGYPSGGNYWSDYEDRYPDAEELDGSGIWDTPYVIDANNQDNYPLMEPYSPFPRNIDELKTEIEGLGSEGEIDNQGIVNSLITKLNVAQKLVDDGKINQAKNIQNAFINEVQAQSGKHITPEAAELLIQSAEHIISHL